jgi:aryl-alcohol dehydrogenase-like predicted oxidoreductase
MLKPETIPGTDIAVSRIGLGTVKLGRNQQVKYPQDFALPSDRQVCALLVSAQELGINLLDTAPAYGHSEERLGKLLGSQRHEWILSTKVGEEFTAGVSHYDFTPEHARKSIERSLQRLKTDFLDIVLVHSDGEDLKIIDESGLLETLAALKQAGTIRAFGMSTKTVAGGMKAVDQSDIVMVTHNPVYTEEQTVIAYAHQQQKGIFIKKALASGHLDKFAEADPVLAALKFIFQEPGVNSVVLGTLSPEHLRHNVACALMANA